MKNKFIYSTDPRRYAEIVKPLYTKIANIPMDLIAMGYSKIFSTFTSPLFDTTGFVLMYISSGKGEADLNNHKILLKQNDLIFYYRSGYAPTFTPHTPDFEYRWLDIFGNTATFYYAAINAQANVSAIHFPEEKFNYHFGKIYDTLLKQDSIACYKICSYCIDLLTDILLAKFKSAALFDTERYQESLNRVFDYVDNHFNEPLTIDILASVFLSSKYHFIRVFKEHTGTTPMQYITNIRIYKAIDLLHGSSLSVEDIAFDVGYKTASQFISKFKRLTGLTPNKYKNNKLLPGSTKV